MRMRRSGEEELAALADGSLAPEHRAELDRGGLLHAKLFVDGLRKAGLPE